MAKKTKVEAAAAPAVVLPSVELKTAIDMFFDAGKYYRAEIKYDPVSLQAEVHSVTFLDDSFNRAAYKMAKDFDAKLFKTKKKRG